MSLLEIIGNATVVMVGLCGCLALIALCADRMVRDLGKIKNIAMGIFVYRTLREGWKGGEPPNEIKWRLWRDWSSWVDTNIPETRNPPEQE